VLGDKHGNIVYLNERECSIQRRHQKVVEEAPSPFVTPKMRKAMGEQCVALAKAVGYFSAGTVELIVSGADPTGESFYFLEMNTRLQVEHPVTEDHRRRSGRTDDPRCEWREAGFQQDDMKINGWAIETASMPKIPIAASCLPLAALIRPLGGRTRRKLWTACAWTTASAEGGEVSMFYDPMIAKLITWGRNAPRSDRQADRGARQLRDRGAGPQYRFRLGDHAAPALPLGRTSPPASSRRNIPKASTARQRRKSCCAASPPSLRSRAWRRRIAPAGSTDSWASACVRRPTGWCRLRRSIIMCRSMAMM
jgi:acetyl/propionyl-CoA carboxylase alpha subunit